MCYIQFFTKLLTLGILFLTVIRAVLAAKLVILVVSPLALFILALKAAVVAKLAMPSISPSTWFILAWREALVVKLVISGILTSIFLISALYTPFFTTSFLLNCLVYLNQQEQVLIYQHLNYKIYLSNYLTQLEYFLVYQYLICLHYILN